jgi:hypothetical protein
MTTHTLDLNHFETIHEQLHLPHLPKKKFRLTRDNIFNSAFYMNVCASLVSCIMIMCLCISGLVIYSDVSKTVVDAQDTLQDLQIILPEVHTTMSMLTHLCNTPEFKDYCGTEVYSNITMLM